LVHIILLIRHFVQLRSPLAYVSFSPTYVLEPYSYELCNALRRINHITPLDQATVPSNTCHVDMTVWTQLSFHSFDGMQDVDHD